MKVKVIPSKANGMVTAPPSKSMAHRALICCALSSGGTVDNIALSDDIKATLGCLSALGAKITVNGNSIQIGQLDLDSVCDDLVLDCKESGSTLRFMIPLCLLTGKKITLIGAKRLFERPLSVYESICREQDLQFEKDDESVIVCGKLNSGFYTVSGEVSSQFISGLLFALPLLNNISIIDITGNFESSSYVELTLEALKRFGIRINHSGNRFIVYGNQKYVGTDYLVEGDYSNAAFLSAFGLFGNVTINGLADDSKQGDRVYRDMFAKICDDYCDFDLSDCPDLAPIMFAVSAAFKGGTFVGTSRLKLKESDRANAMAEELKKFGIPVRVEENSVTIANAPLKAPTTELKGHNDHRIVMALTVLLSLTGGVIDGAEAVAKSYPDFFETIKKLGIGIEIHED